MVSFKRLTRGIKLLLDHVYTPLNTVRTELLVGLNEDSLETGYSTFRLNFYIPYVNQGAKAADNDRYSSITAPFMLPPPQDKFDSNNADIDDYELIELSLSFDSRSEPSNLNGVPSDPAHGKEGLLRNDIPFGFTVHITEKFRDGTANFLGEPFKNEVYKLEIPGIALNDDYRRANPHVQSDLSVPFKHDRVYLMEFVPSKSGAVDGIAMFSLNVSLKFKRKLMDRDGATTQNMPTHNGAINSPAITINTPAANSVITSSGATGVQTNIEALDGLVATGLRGGYLKSGEREDDEVIKSSAGYDVIAVPLFGGYSVATSGPLGGLVPNMKDCTYSADNMPYSAAGAGSFRTMDRAIIPLHYPVTIQHVLIAQSYTSPNPGISTSRVLPTDLPNFTNEVGVGLLTGIRSDNFAVNQVAHAMWTPSTIGTYLIDRSNLRFDPANPTTSFLGYAWDMLACPLVGAGGKGFVSQGNPVFAATGTTPTETRSNLGASPSVTLGAEQALDIRWKISDAALDVTGAPAGTVVVGWPCHWVYIICKKHLI